ncbi:MAG TPA: cysteine--tRNA ligase [Gammaproteobacteria bacterium]|nr:cysteine--tRNA ligase [Gammaproteobacteria bacterium]
MLKIYNTLSKQKEIFKPLQPGKIDLYVCGVTPYDYCHIGHGRVFLIFDVVIRYLRFINFEVNYVRNITDIDDKIIKRAQERNIPFNALTAEFIEAMNTDFQHLNILPPTVEPCATNYIPQMIDMIQQLVDKKYAYVGETGDVYYDIQKFESYGCLSHRDLDDLKAGSRVEINDAKQHPFDFVLWKMAKPNEPSWESPWGLGRPGWHIECSAMSLTHCGETFDIHGGGPDLKFPHHENERAQSEAATSKKFVNYWMHVGFVQQDKEKMSKSLNNFLTIRDFLKHYHPEVLRYFSVMSHYRSPIDYATDNIDVAGRGLLRLYTALRGISLEKPVEKNTLDLFMVAEEEIQSIQASFEKKFQDAMNDDFNTPEAIAVLFEIAHEINRQREAAPEKAIVLAIHLKKLGNILGLLYSEPEAFLQNTRGKAIDLALGEIEQLIAEREKARKSKQWAESDRIRNILLENGILLEDTAKGTIWHAR